MELVDNRVVHVLMVEDMDEDAVILGQYLRAVQHPSFQLDRAARLLEALSRLKDVQPDLVLVDLNLPDSRGISTFERVHQATCAPVVVLSGMDDEKLAMEAVHKGAQDYLVKWSTDHKLLVRSLLYAIERHQLSQALARAESEIESLKQLIPICAYCKRVREDDGFWQQIETHMRRIEGMDFSHGICPDCYERLEMGQDPEADLPRR